MSELVLVKGDRSRLLWANTAFLQYYGLSEDELHGIIDAPHSDPDDTLQYVKDDHHVFTTGAALEVVEPITDSTGAVGYYTTVKTSIQNAVGSVQYTVGVSRPAGESEFAAGQIAHRERKDGLVDLRAMVTHIPAAVAMLDVKQRVVAHSRKWQELFSNTGGQTGDFYDQSYGTLLDVTSSFSEAIESGAAFSLTDVRCRPAPGDNRVVEVHGQPFALPDGEVGGLIMLVHDVTELRSNEARLAQANEELTQFNYRVSHDLVAPLRSIRGLATLVQSRVPEGDPVVDGALSRIVQSADGLSELIKDLMNLARADAAPQPLAECDLPAIVESSLANHRSESRDIDVQLAIDVPRFDSELTRVQQCVENLISNALKYFDDSEEKQFVKVACVRQEGAVEISVSDNGVGMDEATAHAAFDQFFRGSSNKPGHGLGLYLVRKHAERLGGQVRLSSLRKPTTFTLRIPDQGHV